MSAWLWWGIVALAGLAWSVVTTWFGELFLKDHEHNVLPHVRSAKRWISAVFVFIFVPIGRLRNVVATGAVAVVCAAAVPLDGIVGGDDDFVGLELPNEASIPIPIPKPTLKPRTELADNQKQVRRRDSKPARKSSPSTLGSPNATNYEVAQLPGKRRSSAYSSGATFPSDGGDGGQSDCPIVFDMDFSGRIETTGETTSIDKTMPSTALTRTVLFDLQGNGLSMPYDWLVRRLGVRGDAFLVDNQDGKADIDMNNGHRLFGNEGGRYSTGYEKLALFFDANHDGLISGGELASLALWFDDGDGIVQPGELISVAEAGVVSINTAFAVDKNESGQRFMRSQAILKDGRKVLSEDVWFAGEPVAVN